MKKILRSLAVIASLFSAPVLAQTLPAGSVGIVTNNTPNTWQTYTFTFTPTTTGANFIGFAFRQDPAYWTFDNVSLVEQGTTTNLLTNGAFTTGGSFNVTTSNGPGSIQAPTYWGVWYQNGTYPAAAGTWTDIGGTQGGVWYDGAVGTFDGIYQGVVLQAGTTYTISFEVSGNNTANTSSIQLGVYGGACADVSIAAAGCTIPASVGFTTLATPAQGAAAGGPTTFSEASTGNTVNSDTVSTGSFTGSGGTLLVVNAQTTVGNNIDLTTGLTVDTNGENGTLSGVISGSGSLTVTGSSGTLTLTAVNTYTGATTIDAGATLINDGTISSSSGVVNNGTFTNNGTAGNVNNNGTATNNGILANIINAITGLFTNNSAGTVATVDNSGTFTNSGTTGDVTNNSTGTFTNNATGTTGNVTNDGTFNNAGTTGDVANAGSFTNTGTTGDVTNTATFANSGTTGDVTNASTGTFTNAATGTTGNVDNAGTFTNDGTVANVTNSGTMTNAGTAGDVNNTGTFTNTVTGTIANLISALFFTNDGTITGTVTNNQGGTFTNNGTVQGATTNAGDLTNTGTLANLTNSGTADNSGTISGTVTNTGSLTNSGTAGAITNTGTVNNTGTFGTVTNNTGGTFNNNVGGLTGAVTNAATFNNSATVTTVTNTGTFNNQATGTTGAFTNNATGTLTNAGTVASLVNAGTVTNSGTITGATTNTGVLTNSGTTAAITNTGTVTNTGTTGAITNNSGGTFNNNAGGVTTTVLNASGATFTNAGTTGAVTNAGTFTNQATGTTGAVTNSGTFTNAGTTGNVTNSGTFNTTGTSGSLTNTGTSNISGNGTVGAVTNSGTVNISGAGSTGVFNNLAAGLLDFNGTGNIGALTNAGTANLAGSGSIAGITNSGTVTIGGTVSTGNINNTGTVNVASTTATFGTLTNAGLMNLHIAGGDVTAPAFTQTSAGTLSMLGLQKFNLTGPADLSGTLLVQTPPTDFGRYTMITADSVTGTFGTLNLNPVIDPLGAYLKYSPTMVKLYITPSSQHTQMSIDRVRTSSTAMNRLVGGSLASTLGSDCGSGGENGGCISLGFGRTKAGTGDINSGNITVSTTMGKVLSNNYRMGIFLSRAFANPTIDSVSYKPNMPVVGGFIGWNAEESGTGFGITASVAKQNGAYTINRPLMPYAEAGTGVAKTNGIAYQVKASYATPAIDDFIVTPYAGIRYTRLGVGGYTETGNLFPLSIDSYKQSTTDLLGGVTVTYKIWDDLSASVSAGVVKNVAVNAGSIDGTSEIKNMFTFNNPLPGQKFTSGAFGAGLTYEFMPNNRIGVNVGWQHKSITDTSIGSMGVTYSVGF